jgi:hypothetical protein
MRRTLGIALGGLGLGSMGLAHAAWFALAVADATRGRPFDLLDVYNVLATLGAATLLGLLVSRVRGGSASLARFAGIAWGAAALDLVATSGLAVLTLPLA